MQDSTRKLLADADRLWRRPYRMIEFLGGNFKVEYNMISYKLDTISLNNVDMNCDQEDIATGPFTLRFDKDINLEHGNIKECSWDEDDQILKLNGEEIKFIDTNLKIFVADVHVNLKEAVNNLMDRFCTWVYRNYR